MENDNKLVININIKLIAIVVLLLSVIFINLPLKAIFYLFFVSTTFFATYIFLQKLLLKKILFGAPYVSTKADDMKKILILIKDIDVKNVIDLGSGTGNVISSFAKAGYKTTGIEINPILYIISVLKNFFNINKSSIYFGNMWKHDISKYDLVIVFGIPYMFSKLIKKIDIEMRKNTYVLSNFFQIPGMTLYKSFGGLYLYIND